MIFRWRYLPRTARVWFAFAALWFLVVVSLVVGTIWASSRDKTSWAAVLAVALWALTCSSIFARSEYIAHSPIARSSRDVALVLGVTDEIRRDAANRVAIVMPSFAGKVIEVDRSPETFGALKSSYDFDRGLSPVDVRLALNIADLLTSTGVKVPMLIDSALAVSELAGSAENAGSDTLCAARRGADGDRHSIRLVISIGLFSNELSSAIAYSELFPAMGFRSRSAKPDSRTLDLSGGSDQTASAAHGDDIGCILRAEFSGCTVVIVGGVSVSGTARVCEFLSTDDGVGILAKCLRDNDLSSGRSRRPGQGGWFKLRFAADEPPSFNPPGVTPIDKINLSLGQVVRAANVPPCSIRGTLVPREEVSFAAPSPRS